MRNTTLKLVVLATLFANTAYAFELVTPEEASQSQAALMIEAELSAPDPLGPIIQLLDPVTLDLPFQNPFKMEVIFKPQNGTQVDFSTFKAFYGTFKLDITDRLLKEAVKTSSGLRLANVKIPSGRHKLYISIKDNLGHSAAKEIAFKVE
jgi:hypothetical protein